MRKHREARLIRTCGEKDGKTEQDIPMRTCMMEISEHRNIRAPKLGWSDVIRKYMKEKGA